MGYMTTAKFGGVDVVFSSATGTANMYDAATGERIGGLSGIYPDEQAFVRAACAEFGGQPDSSDRVVLTYNLFPFP